MIFGKGKYHEWAPLCRAAFPSRMVNMWFGRDELGTDEIGTDASAFPRTMMLGTDVLVNLRLVKPSCVRYLSS